MFWGDGDSSKLSVKEKELLGQLRRLQETGHIVGANPEQTKTAFQAIRTYGMITATTGLIVSARNVGFWVFGFLAFWWSSKEQLIAFLKHAIGN